LNARSLALVDALLARAEERGVAQVEVEGGGRVIDCGIKARGGLLAGLDLARICMSDLGEVSLVPGEVAGRPCPLVQVVTDQPVTACLASQYAGWQLAEGKFFAMGSGPMRAAYGHEPIFDKIGTAEVATAAVGVLEGRKLPAAT
jgi:methenyltetrahydromethanopterin cyclohydrolase